ncbi:DUF481 domain-containing protein [Sulfurovum sp. NBC37-1]|uniref:DUF481 domain-containing protein n=1 Tax=Sulfurovum sp. (strain NBC37-1) TaxID=387093 RepID=UPI0001587C5C|nr:DUF481 domain-containing protein [Sulfurovum sp. NBC37-1]BAF72861.1 conserved hypothetical protein [Sulfurovum sp. NBC37-1]
MFKKLLLLLLFTSASYSFISLDPPVIGGKEGVDGETGISGSYTSGNSNTSALGFSAKIEYHQPLWMIYSIAAYHYGESNSEKNTNDGLAHLRYIHRIEETPYDYEFFLQTEFNEFQDVEMRNLAGANIRRRFEGFFDKCYVGLGLFYSYMEPNEITDVDPIYKRTKLNSYLSLVKNINEHFSITYLGFYQPNIEDFSDYRTFQILQLNTSVTKNTSLSLDLQHKHNSTPYHHIEENDFRSSINLNYKFK